MKIVMISEILDRADQIQDKTQKIEFLRQHNSAVLRIIIEGAYHPNIRWLLPRGRIAYRPQTSRETYGALHREVGRLYLFVERISNPEATAQIAQWKREKIFVMILESVAPPDAELLLAIKDKTLPYSTLTYDFFREAFPDWLPNQNPTTLESLQNFFTEKKTQVQEAVVKAIKKDGRNKPNVDKGKSWYNDGKNMVRYFPNEVPEGFVKGVLKRDR